MHHPTQGYSSPLDWACRCLSAVKIGRKLLNSPLEDDKVAVFHVRFGEESVSRNVNGEADHIGNVSWVKSGLVKNFPLFTIVSLFFITPQLTAFYNIRN